MGRACRALCFWGLGFVAPGLGLGVSDIRCDLGLRILDLGFEFRGFQVFLGD